MNMRVNSAQLSHSQMIETASGRLAVHQSGQGDEVLVLWPSIFTDHHIYDDLVHLLSPRYRIVLIDGPGHGKSLGPATIGTAAEHGQSMLDVMNALDIERAWVGGTSWGGLTGAELALSAPERVKGLMLMNTPMTLDWRSPGLKAKAISFGARWMLASGLFRNGVAKSFFGNSVIEGSGSYIKTFHRMLQSADPKILSQAVASVLLHSEPLMARLDQIKVPTLVLAGRYDAMYPVSVQAEASLRLQRGHFECVESKHISVVDAPSAVAEKVVQFIEAEAAS